MNYQEYITEYPENPLGYNRSHFQLFPNMDVEHLLSYYGLNEEDSDDFELITHTFAEIVGNLPLREQPEVLQARRVLFQNPEEYTAFIGPCGFDGIHSGRGIQAQDCNGTTWTSDDFW